MIFKLVLITCLSCLALAFTPAHKWRVEVGVQVSPFQLNMVKVVVQSRGGLELTQPMRTAVDSKIQKVVDKLGSRRITTAHVTLRLDSARDDSKSAHAHGQVAEVVCNMKGGGTIKSHSSTDDMYASIDLAAHSLSQNLKKHVSHIKDHKSGKVRESVGQATSNEDAEDQAFLDWDESALLSSLNPKYRK